MGVLHLSTHVFEKSMSSKAFILEPWDMCEGDVPEPRNGGETDRWLFLQLISSEDK